MKIIEGKMDYVPDVFEEEPRVLNKTALMASVSNILILYSFFFFFFFFSKKKKFKI